MKRGSSGLCLVAGVDKPEGMSSHDVVNRCRRIFGERRVGHTGTLDPLASGVLPILIGPATRLDAYMVGHDKRYRTTISFGFSTTTDDAEGEVLHRGTPDSVLLEEEFAEHYLASIAGPQMQMPPVYSAIKKNGRKACDEARGGHVVELEPRAVEIYSAQLLGITQSQAGDVHWDVELHVSKGTYIRSIARDAGRALGCPAHVAGLRRTCSGALDIAECVSLDVLEREGAACAIDPVPLLGYRVLFARDAERKCLENGGAMARGNALLYEVRSLSFEERLSACSGALVNSAEPPLHDELISVVADGALRAIYRFDASRDAFVPTCVFSKGVCRGAAVR